MWLSGLKKIKGLFGSRAIVLMYHRIADPACDPWELAVSPTHFEQQLQILQNLGSVISMQSLAENLKLGTIKNHSIVLTFDDGYIDNYLTAKPLLEKYKIPASFYIPTTGLAVTKEFWWDELERIIIQTEHLPAHLAVDLQQEPIKFDLKNEKTLTDAIRQKHQSWKYYHDPAPTTRSGLYMLLWKKLIQVTASEQQQFLATLREWARIPEIPRPAYTCMSAAQLKEMANSSLFQIGAHTVSHTALGFQPADIQTWEITESKKILEDITGSSLKTFSFPNGSHNHSARSIVKEAGFDTSVTTNHVAVTKSSDSYQIGRFQVNNWSGTEFKRHLNGWKNGFS